MQNHLHNYVCIDWDLSHRDINVEQFSRPSAQGPNSKTPKPQNPLETIGFYLIGLYYEGRQFCYLLKNMAKEYV